MRIGMIGLGRMGANMTERLLRGGHSVVAYDLNADSVRRAAELGAVPAFSLDELVQKLDVPRTAWMMIPAGEPVDEAVESLSSKLSPGDLLIDGGNSRYTDSIRRADELSAKGIHFMDVGVSGGIWGLREGYCLMTGGDKADFDHVEPALRTLAPEDGYAYVGAHGAGHFTKMVHNGIEYGMLEAYGEGFELLKSSPFDLDLDQIASLWQHGSVVRSWLLELAARAFKNDPDLSGIRGYVEDSGEGRWTVQEAINLSVPVPVIALSLFRRFASRQEESFSAKVIAALRHEFGGHRVEKE
jgi:6-phosphogluconate dehydrogenase